MGARVSLALLAYETTILGIVTESAESVVRKRRARLIPAGPNWYQTHAFWEGGPTRADRERSGSICSQRVATESPELCGGEDGRQRPCVRFESVEGEPKDRMGYYRNSRSTRARGQHLRLRTHTLTNEKHAITRPPRRTTRKLTEWI